MSPLDRARLALEGLSLGDAFGERFFGPPEEVVPRIVARQVSDGPWRWTDDTEMALSIVDVLRQHRSVDQDMLARAFATRFDPSRGYGAGAYEILAGVREGRSWRALSRGGFRGMGSFGNGAAMRVAPLGAYFADAALDVVVAEARLSAEITHAHDEGIAGAIAVAVAAALAWARRGSDEPLGLHWLENVLAHTPEGHTREGIAEAAGLAADTRPVDAAKALGNGSGVTAPDTVPLCLWVAAHHVNFEEALWTTVSALGDRDTTCAIVGGLLALKLGREALPESWLSAREPLPNEGGAG